ncbi:MAG: hypothetical protein D3906_13665, partial [Candidatus Electrothrix sp. AUS1_2]|nr:hypothetical protein [Candidatus Electrothrix sp. AUS1_2]
MCGLFCIELRAGMAKKKRGESSEFSVCREKIRRTDSLSVQACCRSRELIRLWREGRVREMRNVSLGADFLHPVVHPTPK